jgi:hypothetical protein
VETGLKSNMKDVDEKYFRNLKHDMLYYFHISRTIAKIKQAVFTFHKNIIGFRSIVPQIAELQPFVCVFIDKFSFWAWIF